MTKCMTNVEAVDLASTVLGLRHIGNVSTDDEALAISRRSVGLWLWVLWRVEGARGTRTALIRVSGFYKW
jgi:hypothetical protein